MDKYIAREFVCMVAEKLNLPSMVCETLEEKLIDNKANEVVEYVVKRNIKLKLKESKK